MESLEMNSKFWQGRVVFLTGHTGFKGGWMALWLSLLGAKVCGYAFAAPTKTNFYTETNLRNRLHSSTIADVRDDKALATAIQLAKPSVIIHMAAQSLVRESYNNAVDTFATNIMGTVHVLEAARQTDTVEAIVNITTDKCYENRGWFWGYRENDRLGGHDPYSSSKACAEIITSTYRNCFLERAGINLASVRAGNVIGGGDWALDRLIPDFFRAVDTDGLWRIRSPSSVRPWQHVLEPLSGYLSLAEKLVTYGSEFAEAWNFGPDDSDCKSVSWIADRLCQKTAGTKWEFDGAPQPHEADQLKLDSSKAKAKLRWAPRWGIETTLDKTVEWHQAWRDFQSMDAISIEQIECYQSA